MIFLTHINIGRLPGAPFLLFVVTMLLCCNRRPNVTVNYLPPQYRPLTLTETTDTVHFPLTATTYNNIRSFNTFVADDKDYIAFHDRQSASIIIYNFHTQSLVEKIDLKALLPYKNLEKTTSVFCKNFDSIFVINHLTLYLFGKDLKIRDTIDFQIEPVAAFGSFRGDRPPLFKNGKMYVFANPNLSREYKRNFGLWRSIYEVNLQKDKTKLLGRLPQIYLDSFYSRDFFEVYYCFNNKGHLVLSYPADTNIYVADLQDNQIAYSGKSKFQQSSIRSVGKQEIDGEQWNKKSFLLRDSYQKIFFDPYRKRYLRIAEHKLSPQELQSGKKRKSKSIIFFDEHFRIIGESPLPDSGGISSLVFTQDGKMFIRTKANDEYALHLLRLEYKEYTSGAGLAIHK